MDIETATREELIQLIVEQGQEIAGLRALVTELQAQMVELEGEPSGSGGTSEGVSTPSWIKPNRPKGESKPRKKRAQGFARKRSQPTRQVMHALDHCGACGCRLGGGSVKRTREVLHIPLVPSEVIEHVFIERRCPMCGKRQTPGPEVLQGEVLGQHRVSLQTMAMIATLHEEGRLPIGVVQWVLQAFYKMELSEGEIVAILQAVAAHGRKRVAEIRDEVRSSPVVHGDETVWRENGRNGYMWGFSTPRVSYFEYRHSRSGQMVEDVMGQAPNTTLVCDFYTGYNRHHGPHQRCWAHLLRAIHDLKERYPDQEEVQVWGKAVHALYLEAYAFRERHREGEWLDRLNGARRFEGELMALCEPFLGKGVPQRVLCQRCQRFREQLFHFVVDPRIPPDNNAAERALRHLTVCRKISGGTRSPLGSETRGLLASLYGTWRLQGLNPLTACCQLFASPQN